MLELEKTFKSVPLFVAQLTDTLERLGEYLALEARFGSKLCDALGSEHYTYLILGDGCDHEIVMVDAQNGFLHINRACENTARREWPCGTCIEFHFTEQSIADMLDQAQPAPPEEIEEPCGFNGVICVGKWDLHFENGWLAKREASTRDIPRGLVDNPVLCFDADGCLESVGEGYNPVAMFGCGKG